MRWGMLKLLVLLDRTSDINGCSMLHLRRIDFVKVKSLKIIYFGRGRKCIRAFLVPLMALPDGRELRYKRLYNVLGL